MLPWDHEKVSTKGTLPLFFCALVMLVVAAWTYVHGWRSWLAADSYEVAISALLAVTMTAVVVRIPYYRAWRRMGRRSFGRFRSYLRSNASSLDSARVDQRLRIFVRPLEDAEKTVLEKATSARPPPSAVVAAAPLVAGYVALEATEALALQVMRDSAASRHHALLYLKESTQRCWMAALGGNGSRHLEKTRLQQAATEATTQSILAFYRNVEAQAESILPMVKGSSIDPRGILEQRFGASLEPFPPGEPGAHELHQRQADWAAVSFSLLRAAITKSSQLHDDFTSLDVGVEPTLPTLAGSTWGEVKSELELIFTAMDAWRRCFDLIVDMKRTAQERLAAANLAHATVAPFSIPRPTSNQPIAYLEPLAAGSEHLLHETALLADLWLSNEALAQAHAELTRHLGQRAAGEVPSTTESVPPRGWDLALASALQTVALDATFTCSNLALRIWQQETRLLEIAERLEDTGCDQTTRLRDLATARLDWHRHPVVMQAHAEQRANHLDDDFLALVERACDELGVALGAHRDAIDRWQPPPDVAILDPDSPVQVEGPTAAAILRAAHVTRTATEAWLEYTRSVDEHYPVYVRLRTLVAQTLEGSWSALIEAPGILGWPSAHEPEVRTAAQRHRESLEPAQALVSALESLHGREVQVAKLTPGPDRLHEPPPDSPPPAPSNLLPIVERHVTRLQEWLVRQQAFADCARAWDQLAERDDEFRTIPGLAFDGPRDQLFSVPTLAGARHDSRVDAWAARSVLAQAIVELLPPVLELADTYNGKAQQLEADQLPPLDVPFLHTVSDVAAIPEALETITAALPQAIEELAVWRTMCAERRALHPRWQEFVDHPFGASNESGWRLPEPSPMSEVPAEARNASWAEFLQMITVIDEALGTWQAVIERWAAYRAARDTTQVPPLAAPCPREPPVQPDEVAPAVLSMAESVDRWVKNDSILRSLGTLGQSAISQLRSLQSAEVITIRGALSSLAVPPLPDHAPDQVGWPAWRHFEDVVSEVRESGRRIVALYQELASQHEQLGTHGVTMTLPAPLEISGEPTDIRERLRQAEANLAAHRESVERRLAFEELHADLVARSTLLGDSTAHDPAGLIPERLCALRALYPENADMARSGIRTLEQTIEQVQACQTTFEALCQEHAGRIGEVPGWLQKILEPPLFGHAGADLDEALARWGGDLGEWRDAIEAADEAPKIATEVLDNWHGLATSMDSLQDGRWRPMRWPTEALAALEDVAAQRDLRSVERLKAALEAPYLSAVADFEAASDALARLDDGAQQAREVLDRHQGPYRWLDRLDTIVRPIEQSLPELQTRLGELTAYLLELQTLDAALEEAKGHASRLNTVVRILQVDHPCPDAELDAKSAFHAMDATGLDVASRTVTTAQAHLLETEAARIDHHRGRARAFEASIRSLGTTHIPATARVRLDETLAHVAHAFERYPSAVDCLEAYIAAALDVESALAGIKDLYLAELYAFRQAASHVSQESLRAETATTIERSRRAFNDNDFTTGISLREKTIDLLTNGVFPDEMNRQQVYRLAKDLFQELESQ